ncbi:hypothetical protein GCM10009789_34060 [Kribbella sancticallisti]|uniref:AMIN-like domain-containing protein n=1 Tax=Kribbella sancticallisti TaxID=460087 RepID=A0ABP4PBZ8_9ACTN
MTRFSTVRHPVRITLAVLAIAALPAGAAVALPSDGSSPQVSPAAAERSTGCAAGWGSLPEASKTPGRAAVQNVRTGRHACFDRLVVDLGGRSTGYQVAYVPVVIQDGSGAEVPTRGNAVLRIAVEAPAYDAAGRPTYRLKNQRELSNVTGYDTFRQVAWGGSFEGRTALALGVRARLPFQTQVIAGPGSSTRLVVDVAHHW